MAYEKIDTIILFYNDLMQSMPIWSKCVCVCVCVCVFSSLRGKESEFFDEIHKLNTKVVK